MADKKLADIHREALWLGPTKAIFNPRVRNLCVCPYHGHPRGCPNFGIKEGCPPGAQLFADVFEEDVFIAAVVFDFGAYLAKKSNATRTGRTGRSGTPVIGRATYAASFTSSSRRNCRPVT